MMPAHRRFVAPLAAALALATTSAALAQTAALAPHRAVYELKLRESRGSGAIDSVRGRIVYEFSGDACEGYALNFRQVTEIGNGEGQTNVSDLRAATWEDGKSQSFRFTAQNYLNQQLDRDTDGRAERAQDALKVTMAKPEKTGSSFEAKTLLPTQHLRKVIDTAAKGETLLEAPVYDGSENGDKNYQTLTVIGKASHEPPADIEAAGKTPELDKETYWPVTISYFDPSKPAVGEQTPIYSMSFDLYANGVSRALKIDYGDFVLDGELKELKFLKASAGCP